MMAFFNIDTQKDFMNKNGALYVPNAKSIKPNLKKIIEFARKKNEKIIHSMDKHYGTYTYRYEESELQKWGGPFPFHCMENTEGQEQIEETKALNPNIFSSYRVRNELFKISNQELIIEKQNFDIFSNPNLISIIESINLKIAFVFGVAIDYCIKAAVLGLLSQNTKVILIEDAIMGVVEESTKLAIEEMKSKGAIFQTTKRVINGL